MNRNSKPTFIKQKQFERIKFFTKIGFEYSGIETLEQYYEAVKESLKKMPLAQTVSIHYKDIETGARIRSISLERQDFRSYQKFVNALDKIESGDFAGSDAVNKSEIEMIMSNFAISEVSAKSFGKSDKMIFEVVGIEESTFVGKRGQKTGNKDCGKQCLLNIVGGYVKDIDKKEFNDLDKMRNYISLNNLPINIIVNSFSLKRGYDDIVESGENIEIIVSDKRGNQKSNTCSKMIIGTDVDIIYLHQDTNATATIIYDEVNQHFDVIKDNEIKFCDDVYINLNGKVIKNNQILFTPSQLITNTQSISDVLTEKRFLVFDYETVIDFNKSSCMQEYSLSVLNLSNSELEDLTNADEKNDIDAVIEIRKRCCMTFLGYDCSKQFINWILENEIGKFFVFVGFNNANFDNFLLLDGLLNYKEGFKEVNLSQIFYNGSQLLNFHMSGRHNTFDIHKHLMGSLKANCNSFKINCCAKKSFDHNKAQQLFLSGGLIDFIQDNEELKEYNEYDVLATAVLFCKYRRALNEIDASKPFANGLDEIKTVGSLIYKVFEESKKSKNYNLPKLSYQQYTDLQKSKIAGRVELFNGVQKVSERLASTDVCSLYPYSMAIAPIDYPTGELVLTGEYMGADVIGFYYCDIDQSNLKARNLPKIYAKKTKIENNWDHEEVLENYLISSVMIELLLKYECKVVIKNGFYFTDKKKSCDMFDFLLDFMKGKNEQDTKKKNKDVSYNPALRETLKLLMNSISGKVIEGLHSEKTVNVDCIADYEKIKNTAQSINVINTIGNKIFVSYEIDPETIISKQRPIYLGVLIYDYSKRYMYEYSYSKIGLDQLLYTDTDASKFRYSKFHSWKKWIDDNNVQVPHHPEVELIDPRYKDHKIYESDSKVFGSFEDELEELVGTDYVFYCLEKKSWCYAVDGKAKFRFKGINDNAIMLTLNEEFIGVKKVKKQNQTTEEIYKIKPNKRLDVYNFAQENNHLSIGCGNEVKFFEQVYTTGEAYLLCCSFRKIVKNLAHNVILGEGEKYNNLMNKIQVNYMMKHINIYKNKNITL